MATSRKNLGRNIRAFAAMKEDLLAEHKGKHALLHDETLVGLYPTAVAARAAASVMYPEGEFAISPKIGAEPESFGSLGFQLRPVKL